MQVSFLSVCNVNPPPFSLLFYFVVIVYHFYDGCIYLFLYTVFDFWALIKKKKFKEIYILPFGGWSLLTREPASLILDQFYQFVDIFNEAFV